MKFGRFFAQFRSIAMIGALAMLASCGSNLNSPTEGAASSGTESQTAIGGMNVTVTDQTSKDPEENAYRGTYQLSEADDFDPLFRFSISDSGNLMLLETDPTVTSWGTDYWGYWSDPFPFENHQVNYIIGLTNTTYRFRRLAGNKIDVTKKLVVQPYPSGEPTTTFSHPGVYALAD